MKVALDTTYILGRGAVKDTYNLLTDGIVKLMRTLSEVESVSDVHVLLAHLVCVCPRCRNCPALDALRLDETSRRGGKWHPAGPRVEWFRLSGQLLDVTAAFYHVAPSLAGASLETPGPGGPLPPKMLQHPDHPDRSLRGTAALRTDPAIRPTCATWWEG